MKIEPLDDKTVKILLSKEDMESFQITYEEMDYKKADTKRVLLSLIDAVKKESSIDLSKGRLYIEAFPYADGGCILYVNLLGPAGQTHPPKHKTSFDTPLIYRFDGLPALCAAAKRLNGRYGHAILKNALFRLDGSYCLSLYTYFKLDDPISRLLGEYGQYFGKGAVASALLREHGQELLAQDAIQTIAERLC